MRNPAVTVEAMCEASFSRTEGACHGRDILAVQDTTVTRSNGVGGDYLHAMIAVDAQDGAVLGALDATFCERDTGQRATRHARAFEDKESYRWLAATERAGQIAGAARMTMVADREADIYNLFARRPDHVDLIVRANHNRTLKGGDKMADRIAAMPRLGVTLLTVPAIPGRTARAAKLSIRFGQITIQPPKRMKKAALTPVILNYIDLREETPPEGIKPIHWRLLTTYKIADVSDALDVAERYAKRWKIEDLFRTMKRKGFNIEALRIKNSAPRNRLIVACMIAATIVMQMVAERDGGVRLRPLTDAFDVDDQPLLEALNTDLEGQTDRQKNPHPKGSLAFATWVCARLGGWTGYYGKPGPIVILSGWTEFQSIKHGTHHGTHLAKSLTQKVTQDV
ncbi:IS4 family transposase [Marivita cryptomonadis]|uniref:IS4 family transposase n=1 Tax=Marivita cryptomonadis TaxID=505252 RepID=UPI001C38CED4|nr:IS4 family transposase [Marivita cryptomonadis]